MGVVALKKGEKRRRIPAFLAVALDHVPDLAQDIHALAEAAHIPTAQPPLSTRCTESID